MASPAQAWHLERLAIVYVRQSSPQQVVEHPKSRARQYVLVDAIPLALIAGGGELAVVGGRGVD